MGLDDTTAKIYGMVANVDHNIGRVLAKLSELKLEQDTIVIFMTDNGPQQRNRFNGGMRGHKGTVYEGGIRVPCFLRWPRMVKPGAKTDRLAAHIDVLPTLLEACGAPLPAGVKIDGKSLMPLVRGDAKAWPDRTLFFQWHRGDEPKPFQACAARNQRWKLVDGKELYDLENDPAESKDLASAHPEIVARLRKEYETWFHDVSSTRGYAPPRIHLGTPHENPVMLTRQDWRGAGAGWAADSAGHWEVQVAAAGKYEVVGPDAARRRRRRSALLSERRFAETAGEEGRGPVPSGNGGDRRRAGPPGSRSGRGRGVNRGALRGSQAAAVDLGDAGACKTLCNAPACR